MATVPQYVSALRARQRVVAQKYGIWLPSSSFEIRTIFGIVNATIAVILKLLVDKGVVTDQEITDAFDTAMGETFGQEPTVPPPTPEPPTTAPPA
jgi:hypothetical protein